MSILERHAIATVVKKTGDDTEKGNLEYKLIGFSHHDETVFKEVYLVKIETVRSVLIT